MTSVQGPTTCSYGPQALYNLLIAKFPEDALVEEWPCLMGGKTDAGKTTIFRRPPWASLAKIVQAHIEKEDKDATIFLFQCYPFLAPHMLQHFVGLPYSPFESLFVHQVDAHFLADYVDYLLLMRPKAVQGIDHFEAYHAKCAKFPHCYQCQWNGDFLLHLIDHLEANRLNRQLKHEKEQEKMPRKEEDCDKEDDDGPSGTQNENHILLILFGVALRTGHSNLAKRCLALFGRFQQEGDAIAALLLTQEATVLIAIFRVLTQEQKAKVAALMHGRQGSTVGETAAPAPTGFELKDTHLAASLGGTAKMLRQSLFRLASIASLEEFLQLHEELALRPCYIEFQLALQGGNLPLVDWFLQQGWPKSLRNEDDLTHLFWTGFVHVKLPEPMRFQLAYNIEAHRRGLMVSQSKLHFKNLTTFCAKHFSPELLPWLCSWIESFQKMNPATILGWSHSLLPSSSS